MVSDVLGVLEQEQDRLDEMLRSFDEAAWDRPSACSGWTAADVVSHLAQTEEAVAATLTGDDFTIPGGSNVSGVDDLMAGWVAAERGLSGAVILERWNAARKRALAALRDADPGRAVTWVATPLKPRTLATTRLAEHWIHAHDIADPAGLSYPDTDALWHIARLAHRTLPYAFGMAGRGEPPEVRLELASPNGEMWAFGPEGAACVVEGSAGEFCRIAGRRLSPAAARTVRGRGPRAAEVLELVRTYA